MNEVLPQNDSDYQNRRWDDYLKHREQLDALRTSQINVFDRAIILSSSGGVGLSIVLLGHLLEKNISSKEAILSSWVFFFLSISSSICSYYLSSKSIEKEIHKLDRGMEGKIIEDRFGAFETDMTRFTTGSSALFFLVGAACLLFFAYVNI